MSMFSTKAEYGVRVMIELGRRHGEGPVSLAEIAESERLPLAYLEHLIARLRKAGLVESMRGAHGGYQLARDPREMTMADVVQALEGTIAPMECFVDHPAGKVCCNHELGADHSCSTKVLWTRVQASVISALDEMTLAELAEFAASHRPSAEAAA